MIPAPDLNEFIQFLMASIQIECKAHTGLDSLLTEGAEQMLSEVRDFVIPNLAKDTWVPYHTVLGPHELAVVQKIHSRTDWSEHQKFQALFTFRAHCRIEVFQEVQLPIMLKDSFWRDPCQAFIADGVMEKAMLSYRKETGKPLISSAFKMIPPRVLDDDNENLVRSIAVRSMRLLGASVKAFPIVKDSTLQRATFLRGKG